MTEYHSMKEIVRYRQRAGGIHPKKALQFCSTLCILAERVNSDPGQTAMNRRHFLKSALLPAMTPVLLRCGRRGAAPPSERTAIGFIGTGNNGINWMRTFLSEKDVQVVAVCDVNTESDGYWDNTVRGRAVARRIVEQHYSSETRSGLYRGCAEYVDFRELLARRDIDAVYIGTPDHWHAVMAIESARSGKDIFCQKPLARTIAEGRAMVRAVEQYGVVFQTGSQQRSDFNFRRVCELVLNGRIGTLHTVKCGLPGGTRDLNGKGDQVQSRPVPKGFDYDLWLGPAPYAPYCPARCHVNFRWIWDYSGGQVTDWGGHHPDIAQWGMAAERSGPTKIVNARVTWADHPIWNTAVGFYFECLYPSGVKLIVSNRLKGGVTFEGSRGTVWANRGRHDAWPKSILNEKIAPDEIHLYRSDNHVRNFLDCVRSRREPVAPVEAGHRSISIAHLGNIAMKLKRNLEWDPVRERFPGDEEANRFLAHPMRGPWHL